MAACNTQTTRAKVSERTLVGRSRKEKQKQKKNSGCCIWSVKIREKSIKFVFLLKNNKKRRNNYSNILLKQGINYNSMENVKKENC